jgi:hypothetical protein
MATRSPHRFRHKKALCYSPVLASRQRFAKIKTLAVSYRAAANGCPPLPFPTAAPNAQKTKQRDRIVFQEPQERRYFKINVAHVHSILSSLHQLDAEKNKMFDSWIIFFTSSDWIATRASMTSCFLLRSRTFSLSWNSWHHFSHLPGLTGVRPG